MSNSTCIIAGSGPSACQYDWPLDIPVLAVSSGCDVAPEMLHFASLDAPKCFPKWLREDEDVTKHVPDWDFSKFWLKYPSVKVWPYVDADLATFHVEHPIASGPLLKRNVPAPRHNSLLFALQVAPRLGYNRCLFIGVDLLPDGLVEVSDVMRYWYPAAQAACIEWVNLSPLSTLCEWMPTEPARLQELVQ